MKVCLGGMLRHSMIQGVRRGCKIAIVAAPGGHLAEMRTLRHVYERYEHVYVINQPMVLPPDMDGRTRFIEHSERDWKTTVNLWEAWQVLRKERVTLILTSGPGPAVPFALVGKLLGIRTIYIETCGQVTSPSLTGRLMYYLADRFFYQWRSLAAHFPRGTYGGLLR